MIFSIAFGALIGGFIGLIFNVISNGNNSFHLLIIIGIGLGGLIGGMKKIFDKKIVESNEITALDFEIEKAKKNTKNITKTKYNQIISSLRKPQYTNTVYMINNYSNEFNCFNEFDCWCDSEKIYLLRTWNHIEKYIDFKIESYITSDIIINDNIDIDNILTDECFDKILLPIKKIKFFQREGDFYTETKIHGGGGGGSTLKGAVIGGLLAGETGAIIGSRQKNISISSQIIKHDERKIILYYYGEQQLDLQQLEFENDSYSIFMTLIPDKEYNAVIATKSSKNDNTVTDQIRELAKLKDEGILTEEEFSEKKKELLAKF